MHLFITKRRPNQRTYFKLSVSKKRYIRNSVQNPDKMAESFTMEMRKKCGEPVLSSGLHGYRHHFDFFDPPEDTPVRLRDIANLGIGRKVKKVKMAPLVSATSFIILPRFYVCI